MNAQYTRMTDDDKPVSVSTAVKWAVIHILLSSALVVVLVILITRVQDTTNKLNTISNKLANYGT